MQITIDLLMKEMKALKGVPPREEEIELLAKIKAGDKEAEHELITRNLRFVVSIAKKYATRTIHLEDLISEGCIGMMIAAKKFDLSKNVKFITYAIWWIRQSIRHYIHDAKCHVSYPYKHEQISHAISKTEEKNEKEKILDRLGSKLPDIKTFLYAMEKMETIVPLDLIEDRLHDYDSVANEILIDGKTEQEMVRAIIEKMPSREALVLALRFGIYDENERQKRLREIGERFNLSRERIRQIEKIAKKRFRKMWLKTAGEQ